MLIFVGGAAGFGTPCMVKPLAGVVFHADAVLFPFELVQAADPTIGLGAAITGGGADPANPGSGLHKGWFVASSRGTSQKWGAG